MSGKNKNLLFLTLVKIQSLEERGIYTDLIKKFHENGFNITIISPIERREKKNSSIKLIGTIKFISIKTFNIQKTNIIEKGLSTLLIEFQFLKALKKHTNQTKFDLVLYSTPPITIVSPIQYIKNRDNAICYLLLKDIFPQNAVDLGILKRNTFLFKYFRKKEQNLYKVSDFIGCMSKANREYILKMNEYLNPSYIEINPNSIIPKKLNKTAQKKIDLKNKFCIPLDATIFIYGGNLGLPQGLDFLIKILDVNKEVKNKFFLIVGSGTESKKISKFIEIHKIKNALFISMLNKDDYDQIVECSDVGLIFLNNKFTIPNFPSRILTYFENKLPIITATDKTTDLGQIIEENNAGISLINGDIFNMQKALNLYVSNKNLIKIHGENGHKLLMENYHVDISFQLINSKLLCIN